MMLQRGRWAGVLFVGAGVVLGGGACSTPIVKPEAFEEAALERASCLGISAAGGSGERTVEGSLESMGLRLAGGWTAWVGWREAEGIAYCQVVEIDPSADRLTLRRLPPGESPVRSAAGRPALGGSFSVSLRDAIASNRLGPPIPVPRNIFAVAANFPSHLEHDLAVSDAEEKRETLRSARPRVFRKHPPPPVPGAAGSRRIPFSGWIGPYDDLAYPSRISLPADVGGSPGGDTATRLDYEVEVGVVLGETLGGREAGSPLTDAEIWAAVGGFVLMSDAKARNPQVLLKVAGRDRPCPAEAEPYRTGNVDLDDVLGWWDSRTCAWWSHAGGFGDYAAAGPFFLATPGIRSLPSFALAAARSYAGEAERGFPPPSGRDGGRLLLRQASTATTAAGHPDALFWDVPAIVRSILAPDGPLAAGGAPPELEAGDVICLGTPGGTVLTARSQGLFNLLATFLSTWTPVDWHDFFFDDDAGLYLNPGDELLLWAENLGFQRHRVRRVDVQAP